MKIYRPLPLITSSILAATLLAAAPATASTQEPAAVICKGGTLTLTVDAAGHAAGSGTLTDCAAPGRPDITSAILSVNGSAPISLPGLTLVTSTDTITWNTGDKSTVTTQRTYIGKPEKVTQIGAGLTLQGLFHPSLTVESGQGISSPTKSSKKASAVNYTTRLSATVNASV
jgi:hypothetical protein